ncbi:MAG: heavy-metal-associated domain-containing protein, partial [Spirillospora sp.]
MRIPGASLARTMLNAPVAAAGKASRAVGAFTALAAGRRERHVWAHGGRVHIQVNGLSGEGPRHLRYVRALTEALRRLDGVNWAEVNAVTGHVLVAYEEGDVGVDDLVEVVEDVEEARRARHHDEDAHARWPDDEMAWAAATSALAADMAGAMGAVAGRLLALPPVPSPVRAAVAVADSVPH